jgi:hypothetical protein
MHPSLSHPERSGWYAKRSSHEVEEPAPSEAEGTSTPSTTNGCHEEFS